MSSISRVVQLLLLLSISTCRATITCRKKDTLIKTDFLLTKKESCGELVAQVTDARNPDFREECARWLLLDSVPEKIDQSYVFQCVDFLNGTVKYRAEVCCKGKPNVPTENNRVCFSCQDDPVLYDEETHRHHTRHCDYYGDVEPCATGEVCYVVLEYSEGNLWGNVTKGCMPTAQCDSLAAQNEDKCDHVGDAQCSYCCEDDYCNADHPVQKVSATGVCGLSNPCYKRGKCTPQGDSYKCECFPGRFGPQCRKDACDLNPCQNDGVCYVISSEPFYACHCHNHWTGVNCFEDAPFCAVNNCMNGGTCYRDGEDRCLCADGFVGKFCEYSRPTDCGEDSDKRTIVTDRKIWMNNGDCTYVNDVRAETYAILYQKQCFPLLRDEYNPGGDIYQPGFHGEFPTQKSVSVLSCEQGYGLTWATLQVCCASCGSNPCQNGGWCMQDSGSEGFICRCRLNYGGFLCENKLTSCSLVGGFHYFTFDGERYPFRGLCKYTMVENQCPEKLPPFAVLTKNEVRGTNTDITYPKYVEVEVYNTVFQLNKGNILRVNGADVTDKLPLTDPKGESRFLVNKRGLILHLETDFGLIVEFDGKRWIKVQVPPEASGCVDGLCRTYDDDTHNDYVLPDGTDIKDDPNAESLLGNFYQVPDPDESECDTNTHPNLPECDDATKADIDSNTYCGEIKNAAGPFASCIASNRGTSQIYMKNCRYDVCVLVPSGDGAMKDAACASLEAFEAVCKDAGFSPSGDWRATTKCELSCPGDLVFKASTSACVPTCQQPSYPEQCPFDDTENCVCPDDTHVVTKGNKCIPAQKCGCVEEGRPIGDSWMNSDCTERYQCVECTDCARPVGTVTKSSFQCPEGEACLKGKDGQTTCEGSPWKCEPIDPESECKCIAVHSPP